MITSTIIGKELARALQLSQSVGQTAADIVFEVISGALLQGENIRVRGFGTFAVRHMAEREGHNPYTGERMTIPASIGVNFRPHGALKDALNPPLKRQRARPSTHPSTHPSEANDQ